ncbi:hypothetical protein GGR57DRAFT_469103 [Xylariaceae sp. FL1272]|nr:hypothetical protein GGR57DRAFT_469103 [Xylariaceae sp. FL1272]
MLSVESNIAMGLEVLETTRLHRTVLREQVTRARVEQVQISRKKTLASIIVKPELQLYLSNAFVPSYRRCQLPQKPGNDLFRIDIFLLVTAFMAVLVINDLIDNETLCSVMLSKLSHTVRTHGTGKSTAPHALIPTASRSSQHRAGIHLNMSKGPAMPKRKKGPGGNRPPPQRAKKPEDEAESGRPFACHFGLFDSAKHRDCLSRPQKRISDIRTHIRRKHLCQEESYCPRCFRTFENDTLLDQRDAHIRQRTCQSIDFPSTFTTQTQWDQMQAASEGRIGSNAKERWYVIWDILFPGIQHPASPYLDDVEITIGSRDPFSARLNQFRDEGGIQVFDDLMTNGHRPWRGSYDLFNQFIDFIREWSTVRSSPVIVDSSHLQLPLRPAQSVDSRPSELGPLPLPYLTSASAGLSTAGFISQPEMTDREMAGITDEAQAPPPQESEPDDENDAAFFGGEL